MSKLLTALLASATVLTFSTSVWAADQTDPQSRDNQTQAQPNATKGKPEQSDAQGAGDESKSQTQRHAKKRHHDSQASDTNNNSDKYDPQANSDTQTPSGAAGSPGQHDAQAAKNDRMKEGSSADDRHATGANDPASNQSSDQANRSGAQPNTQGSSSDEGYSVELKKCDSMQGDRKQKCITSAKKKAGQM